MWRAEVAARPSDAHQRQRASARDAGDTSSAAAAGFRERR
jgi:hypothetical protein